MRGWTTLGARDCISRCIRWNRVLETMAGNAFSTRTGSSLPLPDVPHTKVPVRPRS